MVIEVRVDLRRRLVQNHHIAASQDGTSHCDKLAFARTQGTSLTDGHIQRDLVALLDTLERAFEDGREMTSLEDAPAFLIGVFVEGIQVFA